MVTTTRLLVGSVCLAAVATIPTRAFAPVVASRARISTTCHVLKKPLTQAATVKKTISKPATYETEPASSWQNAFAFAKPESTPAVVKPKVGKIRATPSVNGSDNDAESTFNAQQLLVPLGFLATVVVIVGTVVATNLGLGPADVAASVQEGIANPQGILQGVVNGVQAMGPAGAFYFGLFYCIAELLAVPATPLTLSAGTLFGWGPGVGIVLAAGTVAACVGFLIGKTFLRSYVEGVVADNPKFSKLDNAIGKDGFKLLVLVRLSPIFPFSLTNYIYGSSSIDFVPFFWGTLLGFTPSTIAYVYTGMVGQELLMGDATQPWYVYAGGLGALLTLLKLVTDVATGLVEAIEEDNEDR